MKNNYFRFIFIFFCLYNIQTKLIAQNNLGILNGKLIDDVNKESIPFVSITYYKDIDSLNLKSLQSDNQGVFSIKNLSLGNYTLKFSFVGYQVKKITKITLEESRLIINLGDIALSPDQQLLNEVVIEYKKPIVEMQDDKIVYNVDQSIFAEGSVATDILKNVPMVTVDIDGKATLAGKRNTRIFIDGKPSDYSSSSIGDLLSVLPSDALESVEVITDPSSKFDADGDGIINIVLKKGKKVGLTGNLSSRVGTLGNHNTGAFVSKKDTKYSFSGNLGYNHGNRLSGGNSNRSNLFQDTTFYNDQSNNSERISDGFNARFGGNYQLDSAQNLKFSARGGFNNGTNNSLSDNLYLDEQKIEKNLRSQNNNSGNNNFDYALDADYSLIGKNKSQYAVGFNFSKNSSNSDRDYARYNFNADGTPRNYPVLQLNDNDNLGYNLEVNADYDHSFNFLNTRLETGLKGSFNNSDESQAVQNYDYALNQYVFNPSLTNAFNFNQHIFSGYLSIRFKIQKWSFRAGNRAEITDVTFKQENSSNFKIDPYLSLFPSLSVNRSFKSKYSIGVNYSRRIARPRQNALNPIIDDSDPQNLKYGNPSLIPSYTDQYELNFSVFSKDWSFSPRLSYSISNKIIERIKTVSSDGNSNTTYQNLANSSALNFNLFGNYRASKNQTFNAGFTLSKIRYTSAANEKYNRNGINIRSNVGANYSFKKGLAVEANLNYIKNTAAQGVSNGSVETQFGMRKNFMKNKLGFRFTAVDPFTQRNFISITEGPNFYQESYSLRKTRNFLVSLSYRFTKIEKKKS